MEIEKSARRCSWPSLLYRLSTSHRLSTGQLRLISCPRRAVTLILLSGNIRSNRNRNRSQYSQRGNLYLYNPSPRHPHVFAIVKFISKYYMKLFPPSPFVCLPFVVLLFCLLNVIFKPFKLHFVSSLLIRYFSHVFIHWNSILIWFLVISLSVLFLFFYF